MSISFAGVTTQTTASQSGRWSVELPAMRAGGPYRLTARGSAGQEQSASDVVLGDVFLCSGQSNMEMQVSRVGDAGNEISNSANNAIRMLTVEHASSATPLAAFQRAVSWQVAAPATVPEWSATCYFFGREIEATVHVPVGLIHSSWGGSNIRPWLSAPALKALGGYETGLDILATYSTEQDAAQLRFGALWEQWWRDQTGERDGSEPWGARIQHSSVSEADWHAAPTPLGDWRYWNGGTLRDFTGLLWYRTTVSLTAAEAASAVTLTLGPINQVDETWVNGRVLGNTFGFATERTYPLPRGLLHAGENVLVINVLSRWGGGGLLDGGPKRAVHLAGGASVALDGRWEYRVVPASVGFPPHAPWEPLGGLSVLYNAMIAPLRSYGIRGILWYQGEANTTEPGSYQSLLAAFMGDSRRQFGADLPVLVVQLPNFGVQPTMPAESGWAEIREAQRQAVGHDLHAGLAVTIDIGEAHNLHPTNKQDVARRLARAARRAIYGETIPGSGPVAVAAARGTGTVAVEFGEIERGLVAYSHDKPIGFELCAAAGGTCRFVDSRIDGARVILGIPAGMSPARVRYCWGDSPVCTLFDASGLPAGPFEIAIAR